MKQEFLGNMKLWCHDSDRHEIVIIFKDNIPNFRMLDPMWIVNMPPVDIRMLLNNEIFYEDKFAF
ncbi:hypothetical protein Hanom_Chr02g00118281 [Helianthus anomalus]